MTARLLRALLACAFLSACSGGGGSGTLGAPGSSPISGGNGGGTTVAINPGDPGNYAIHYVIEDGSGRRGFDIVPAGSSEDSSFQPQPAPGVVVTYPDGSQQVTAADGTFNPAKSTYFNANLATLETNPDAAAYVTVTDPSAKTVPLYTQLDASWITLGGAATLSASARRLASTASVAALASVSIRPGTANAISGSVVPIEVVGVDSDGNVEDVGGFSIKWSASAGAVSPVVGTASALYTAPASGSGYDVVSAVVTAPGTNATFSASANFAYFDSSNTLALSGVVSSTKPLPQSPVAAFMQRQNVPAVFGAYFWFAPIDPVSGAFTVQVPKNVTLTPLAEGGFNGTTSFVGLSQGGGAALVTGSVAAAPIAFTLPAAAPPFVPPTPAPPPPVGSYISDAWNASGLPQAVHLFDADSGLNEPPPNGVLSYPHVMSTPAPVPAGLLSGWSYQWELNGGSYSLTLVEASNGVVGTHSATIVPQGNGEYSYISYVSPVPLSTANPLVAQQSSSVLDSGGTWTQSGSPSTTFNASVTIQYYTATRQTLGAPDHIETLVYSRSAAGVVTFLPDTVFDSASRPLWSLVATRSASNASNYGTSGPVYSYTGSLTRYYYLSNGQQSTASFDLSGATNGDGSGQATYKNHATGQTVSYSLVAPGTSGALRAQNGVVTDPNLVPSQIATFSVSAGGVVNATVFADPANGFPGNPLSFSL